MARIRTIKPEFFLHEGLAELSREARLLFIGLWTQADRRGVLEDRPRRIKACLFPYDDDLGAQDIDRLLWELHEHSEHFAIRYECSGNSLILIPAFELHQNVHRNEKDSKFSTLRDNPDATIRNRDDSGNYTSAPEKVSNSAVPPGIQNQYIQNPESVSPESERGSGGKQPEVDQSMLRSLARPRTLLRGEEIDTEWAAEFVTAWQGAYGGDVYPHEVAGHLAEVREKIGHDELLKRFRAYCADVEGRYASIAKFTKTHGSYSEKAQQAQQAKRARASPLDAATQRERQMQAELLERRRREREEQKRKAAHG